MVKAILEGRKTQTRRICKPACDLGGEMAGSVHPARESGWIAWWPGNDPGLAEFTKLAYKDGFQCPYGKPGDRLWVRETWCHAATSGYDAPSDGREIPVWYRASDEGEVDASEDLDGNRAGWKPSIHMPRWASRITLEITSVKAERLQDISQQDVLAEGIIEATKDEKLIKYGLREWPWMDWHLDHQSAFKQLWQSIHGPDSWATNPWLWVIEFKRVEK